MISCATCLFWMRRELAEVGSLCLSAYEVSMDILDFLFLRSSLTVEMSLVTLGSSSIRVEDIPLRYRYSRSICLSYCFWFTSHY